VANVKMERAMVIERDSEVVGGSRDFIRSQDTLDDVLIFCRTGGLHSKRRCEKVVYITM